MDAIEVKMIYCDGCHGRVLACVTVVLPSGRPLTLCQHHANEYERSKKAATK